ncbi:hypothetical protein L3Q82_004057 [Scortum barcoo]|uniref:Uncharacterized protein n=1 Tax=Scortum barcoo TaxID=214431 RepID=A0ACB8X6K7_9TELE|nr:hypothetical protein L3Q82_004057 [Scortum barcoo]
MYSELECGICYRNYNAGRRCPRELRCKHSFCESCLLALSRALTPGEARQGAGGRSIACPLCRHRTDISGEGKVRAELRVDEGVLERLMSAGVLDNEDPEEEEEVVEEEEEECQVQGGDDGREEATLPDTAAEESDSSVGSRGRSLRRSWRKVWRKISGKRGGERRDNTVESFIPVPHDTGNGKSVVSSFVNTTARGSVHPYKPGQTIKSIYGFRGFKSPVLGAVKEPSVVSSSSSKERTGFLRYSFDKGRYANMYPSLSPKYMFGQKEAQTLTAIPAELEGTPADYSPGTSDIVQTSTVSRRIIFKEARPVIPESDAGRDSNPDRKPFRIYRRLHGLKGFGTQPLEGAKTSVPEPDKSTRVQQGFEGFKLTGSQIWQPKSSGIHGWYNKIGETEPGSSHVSTVNQNEQSSEDLEPLLKTTGSPESRFRPDKYKNEKKYKEQNPTTASESHRVSSAYLRLAGDFRVESSPKSDKRPPSETKPVEMRATLLNRSTSSTVRGKRVKGKHNNGKKLSKSTLLTNGTAILRLPKLPARYKAVTYSDILGSASFSGVSAVTPTTITPPDKDYSPEATASTRQDEREGHQTSPDEGEDFSSVKENNHFKNFKKANIDEDPVI